MNMNVACSVSECQESVIGQCQGFHEPCGRFYCSRHSKGKLCDECYAVSETERVYKEYESDALYVKGKAGIGTALLLALGIIIFAATMALIAESLVVWVVCSIVPFIIVLLYFDKSRKKRLDEICEQKKDFLEFYNMWLKQYQKEALSIAGRITLGAIAASLSNEAQISRDVRRISNRLDHM